MSAKARSPSGKTAWGDYGGARPDPQFDFGQEPIRDDADLSPTAMEGDDVYMSGDRNKSTAVANTSKNQSKSCFAKIGGGIRSLWATRQTEDVKGDRELHVKTTLRELIIYIVFLVILCIVTFGMTQTTMYYYTKVMSDLFLDKTHSSGGSFRTITSVEDFWKFAKGPLVNGLYWETWYNNATVPEDQQGYIYYENKLLGVPRLRQLQVHSNSCVVHDDFKNVIRECYESYSESLENKQPFGEAVTNNDNDTAWKYQTQDELDGSSHWGKIATYSGAGYVKDLTNNKSESAAIIDYLFDKRWIRRGTRVLFIDFTVYNANINLFCVIRLTVEFPPTGGAIPHATMRTVKLIRYVTVMDYFIMACEFILCLFIFYYMVEEAIEIKKHKFSYFKSVWNILDILVIVIALVCVAFNVYRTLKVDELLKELLDKPDQYADFEFLSYGQTQFDNAIAIAVFLAWIKIFKYISFNKTMTQLSSTLGKCAKDLAGFAVMFFIIFLAFTQLGYLLFGTQVKDFSDFQNSFFTLFRIILGDFDFDQLEAANRVLGPIFFMLFVFFVFFVLINMFLAIINDTYSEVKGDMANQKNEFEMGDYFKRGYEKMLNKLNFKHDKIVDIQKALQSADINNDQQVDFDEWRQDLKTRGYADAEIEALFAKYDMDGDRVLDKEEQKKMQADLAHQKDALKKEYDELDKIDRPESARRSTSRVSFNDDSADDSDDEDSHTKSSRSGPSQSVSYEEFTVLSRRVDRMEHSIGSIVSKIDAVLVKLEAMEKAKLKRRETMGKILDSITESDGTSDEVKREQMERLVREELERWDSESSITPQASASGRGASPISSGHGARSRSRPASGGNPQNVDNVSCEKKNCEETVNPHILETLSFEDMNESENRLDQTEHDCMTRAHCESAETQTSGHGHPYPNISVSTCDETITPSIHYDPPYPELVSQTVQTSVNVENSVTSSQVHSTACVTGERIDIRPVTPILPGIPSSSYSPKNINNELELSLLNHDSDVSLKGNISSLPLKHDTSLSLTSRHVTDATGQIVSIFPQLYRPSSANSDNCNDPGSGQFSTTNKSSERNLNQNTSTSQSTLVISDSINDLEKWSSWSAAISLDKKKGPNTRSSRPISKSSDRNDDPNTSSSRPTSKSSDRSDGPYKMSSRPTSKSSNRNIDLNTGSSRPTSKSPLRNGDPNTSSFRPTSKSSDRNDDQNIGSSRPTSKSSDRSDDQNTKPSRTTLKGPDRNDDQNIQSSRPTSKSPDRNDDQNIRSSRPTSKSSDRNDDPITRPSRPTSKSSDRSDDPNIRSSRPASKSSEIHDDQNTRQSRPTSKSSDRIDDQNIKSSRPTSKSTDRSDDPNTKRSKTTLKSQDRNDNQNIKSSRTSSKSSDRSDDQNTKSSRPPSKSSDINDDQNIRSSRPTSKSSDINDDQNIRSSRPTSKSSDRNDDQNIRSSRPTSKSSDRNDDQNIKSSRPSSKSSDRSDDLNMRSSRPASKSSNSDDDPNKWSSRSLANSSDKNDIGKRSNDDLSACKLVQKNQERDIDHESKASFLKDSQLTMQPSFVSIQYNNVIEDSIFLDKKTNLKFSKFESLPRITDSQFMNAHDKHGEKNCAKLSEKDENEFTPTGKDVSVNSESPTNEKKEDLNQVRTDNDNSALISNQTEKLHAGVSPKTIVTAKGQKVSLGTLSKMAGKRKGRVKNVTDNTKPQTAVNDLHSSKSKVGQSVETLAVVEKDSVKNSQTLETQSVESSPSKIEMQNRIFSTANERSFHTGIKEVNRKETSRSPLRSAESVSVNSPVDIGNGNHSVLQKTSTGNDRDTNMISLPSINKKTSKEDTEKPDNKRKVKVKEGTKANLTNDGQKIHIGKRPAPPIPVRHGANTGSVNAHGEGNHNSESKFNNEGAVFV